MFVFHSGMIIKIYFELFHELLDAKSIANNGSNCFPFGIAIVPGIVYHDFLIDCKGSWIFEIATVRLTGKWLLSCDKRDHLLNLALNSIFVELVTLLPIKKESGVAHPS